MSSIKSKPRVAGMFFSASGGFKGGLAAVAAFILLVSAPAWAAEAGKPPPRKIGRQAVEEKKTKSLDFVVLVPSDTKLITLFGLGFQMPVYKDVDLRIEGAYGSKSATVLTSVSPMTTATATVTSMPFVAAARYPFFKRKSFQLYGEGGLEYNMVTSNYKSQTASVSDVIIGGGGEYIIGNDFFAHAGLRFHSSTISNTTHSLSALVGLGMKF